MPPRLARLLFAGAIVAILGLALWPLDAPIPLQTGWDKADHAAAFFVLGVLGLAGWPLVPGRVLLGLLAYGGLIEVFQGMTSYRHADWRDLAADAVGVALAALLAAGWQRLRSS